MTDADLSMFVCKEYIDLMLHDYRGIDQHQFFGYNMFSKETFTWDEINPTSLEATKFTQKLLSYVLQKLLYFKGIPPVAMFLSMHVHLKR